MKDRTSGATNTTEIAGRSSVSCGEARTNHGWCQSLYYVDPNGIMVELCRDTPGFEPDRARARELLTDVVPADTV